MKRLIGYIALLLIIVSIGCTKSGEKRVDWYPYFESQFKKAYGTYIFEKELENIFPQSEVNVIKTKTDAFFEDYQYMNYSSFIYMNKSFYPDSLTLHRLFNFTQNNNALFISTNDFSHTFFKNLGVTGAFKLTDDTLKLKLTHFNIPEQSYAIQTRQQTAHYFSTIPENAQVLGTIEIGDTTYPNFISMIVGTDDAVIQLHAEPFLFTNYHMMHERDGIYAINCMASMIHSDIIYWDGYGTQRRYFSAPNDGSSTGMLRYIMSSKALLAGFLVLNLLVFLLLAFNYKRKVRPMAIHQKPKNHSVAFMKMVASLFIDEKNHIDLARYRVNYILERIKHKYHLNISNLDDEFIRRLASHSTFNEREINRFVWQLNKVKRVLFMDRTEFIEFNKTIEKYIYNLDIHHDNTRNK